MNVFFLAESKCSKCYEMDGCMMFGNMLSRCSGPFFNYHDALFKVRKALYRSSPPYFFRFGSAFPMRSNVYRDNFFRKGGEKS